MFAVNPAQCRLEVKRTDFVAERCCVTAVVLISVFHPVRSSFCCPCFTPALPLEMLINNIPLNALNTPPYSRTPLVMH